MLFALLNVASTCGTFWEVLTLRAFGVWTGARESQTGGQGPSGRPATQGTIPGPRTWDYEYDREGVNVTLQKKSERTVSGVPPDARAIYADDSHILYLSVGGSLDVTSPPTLDAWRHWEPPHCR